MFVTAIVAELDIVKGTYRWINAGHLAALLLRGGRVVKEFEEGINPPLGLNNLPIVMEEVSVLEQGRQHSYRCRSEPQMFVVVIRTIASVGSSIRGSGTSSARHRACRAT